MYPFLTRWGIVVGIVLAVGCARVPVPTRETPTAAPKPSATNSITPTTAPVASATERATVAPTIAPVGTSLPPTQASDVPGDAVKGAALFKQLPCSSCHDAVHPFPGGDVCPNLGNIATEAGRILRAPDYKGKAKTPAEYIRESIMDPNAYIVGGENYSTPDGQSVMPKDFGKTLTAQQIDDLVAYLVTLK